MKILFISCRNIWDGIGGRENTIKSRIEYLASHNCHCDIFYFFKNKKNRKKYNISEYSGINTHITTKLTHSFFNAFSKKKPLQYSLFYSNKNKAELKQILLEKSYDFIIVDMIRLAPLYSFLNKYKKSAKLILDLDDIISKRYQVISGNVLGSFANENKKLDKILEQKLVRKLVLNTEYKKLYNSEIYYSKLYDISILVNPYETEELNKNIGKNKAYNLSPFVKKEELVKKEYKTSSIFSLFFLGSLKMEQNRASFENIVANILPKISIPYKFYVVGKNKQSDIDKYLLINKNIEFTGYIENLNDFLLTMDIMISPIAFGTGVKTKILSAMGHGIPVITNDCGAYGIKCENGENIFIINEFDEIAYKVNYLYNNQSILENIGDNAFDLIVNNYSETIFEKSLEEIQRNLK